MDVAEQATHTRERVEVARGAEPASSRPAAETPLTLKQRMAAIRDDAFGIGKDTIKMKSKAGVEFTITGHTIEAVLSEMRPLFAKYGVDMTPNLVERTYTGNRCDVLIDFLFERTDDSDETRTIRWAGAGTDDGDKGFSKAGTNCLKEMLKKRFLITDRDDAKEEEDKVQHRTDDPAATAALERARERTASAIQQWGNTFRAALLTAKTAQDIARLQRENSKQLSDDSLPEVTRAFFIDLIQERKKALADDDERPF